MQERKEKTAVEKVCITFLFFSLLSTKRFSFGLINLKENF